MSKGNIKGIQKGQRFSSCLALSQAKIHQYQGPTKKSLTAPGIVTDNDGISRSILLNGGYIDDEDFGDKIIYTGSGGQEKRGKKIQVEDQVLDGRAGKNNQGLVNAFNSETPLRVIRGWKHKSNLSPSKGYRYDGLYFIHRYWWAHSIHGPVIIRFELHSEELFKGKSEYVQWHFKAKEART